jgi:hypothetical protein
MTEIRVSEKKVLKVMYPSKRKAESGRIGRSFIICNPLLIKAVLYTSLGYTTGVEILPVLTLRDGLLVSGNRSVSLEDPKYL